MIGGAEVLERGGDMPEPWLIDMIRNPQEESAILRRLGELANRPALQMPVAVFERQRHS